VFGVAHHERKKALNKNQDNLFHFNFHLENSTTIMAIVESACLGLFNEVKTALANKPDSVSIEHLVNEKDPFGDTALHYACLKGNLLLVRFLISQGADVNIQNEVR
jgi:ankyrin repeat protein